MFVELEVLMMREREREREWFPSKRHGLDFYKTYNQGYDKSMLESTHEKHARQ